MPTQRTIDTYTFDELDDAAKERAREWWRRVGEGDDFWSEWPLDDAKAVLKLIGFTIDRIYYSGFWSQGDGACFEGAWSAANVNATALKAYAPVDKELHRIADAVQAFAVRYPGAFLTVKHRGHYYHQYETVFTVQAFDNEDNEIDVDEQPIIDAARDAMEWIYRQLKATYEYKDADAQVDDTIRANEYEFTKEGKRSVTL